MYKPKQRKSSGSKDYGKNLAGLAIWPQGLTKVTLPVTTEIFSTDHPCVFTTEKFELADKVPQNLKII